MSILMGSYIVMILTGYLIGKYLQGCCKSKCNIGSNPQTYTKSPGPPQVINNVGYKDNSNLEHLKFSDNQMIIKLDDLNGTPKVFYKGKEISGKLELDFKWETNTETKKNNIFKLIYVDKNNSITTIENTKE